MKRKPALILSIAAISGIAVVALVSRQSDQYLHSRNQSVSNVSGIQKQTFSAKENADAATKEATADAAASIARPAPAEPADIEMVLNRKLAQSGERIEPKVTMPDGNIKTPIVNEVGEMEFINVNPEETVSVTVNYPQGTPGEKVIVATYDGGVVNDTPRKAAVIPLDEAKNMTFKFKVGADRGRYQVALEKGADEKVFRVWAGKEAPLRTAKNN